MLRLTLVAQNKWKKNINLQKLSGTNLVVWVEVTAVNIVVVASKHGNQLAGVEGIHGNGASTGHKHKLRAAAMRYCEL